MSSKVPKGALVTGGSGFVGRRLVEMLVESGCNRVVSFDITPHPPDAISSNNVTYIRGDITKYSDVLAACKDVDCVFHIAALVGPYHAQEAYMQVNFHGTENILRACNELGIKRIVMSSSPSNRFPYPDPDINYLTEDELAARNGGDFAPVFIQPYAATKAMGEKLIRDACGTRESDLLTIAVAPHQVYGPRDSLTLPSLLQATGDGLLRIFGDGRNLISLCHVDNYCHGLILGYNALYEGSPALGKFYVITDDAPVPFWHALDDMGTSLGFESMKKKLHIPAWLIMFVAYLALYLGKMLSFATGLPEHKINFKLKLNPFAVKMLLINRTFNIKAAKNDLHYKPIISFEDGWKETTEWFRVHWLPKYRCRV